MKISLLTLLVFVQIGTSLAFVNKAGQLKQGKLLLKRNFKSSSISKIQMFSAFDAVRDPLTKYCNFYVENLPDIPKPVLEWFHPVNMLIVLFVMASK